MAIRRGAGRVPDGWPQGGRVAGQGAGVAASQPPGHPGQPPGHPVASHPGTLPAPHREIADFLKFGTCQKSRSRDFFG